jgi:VanZ family protein
VRTLALLAILTFVVMSALASIYPEWFVFVRAVPGRDKLLHCLGVGLLAVVTVIGFSSPDSRHQQWRPFWVLAAIALLVTLEEFGQLAIPTRAFDLADLAWSYTGMALFGLPAVWLIRLRRSAG